MGLCLVVLLSIAVATADGRQGAGTRDPGSAPPPAAASGVIGGVVTAADTGRPLRRVQISLANGQTNRTVAVAVTDLQGRFRLERLPAGAFTLRATRGDYLEVVYGQQKPGSGRPGTPIQLAAGQRIEDVALQMPRGGVIWGTVVDEVGDPAPNVQMRALKFVWRDGNRELSQTGFATSDDRGVYRIFKLPPGEYVICAAPRDELVMAALQGEAVRQRMQDIAAQAARGGGTPETQQMVQRMSTAVVAEAPKDAYVPVCVPGTTQMTAATSMTLDVAEQKTAGDLQLQLVPIARVSGKVVWTGGDLPIGNAAGHTYVMLEDRSAIPGGASMRGMHVPPSGEFSFLNIPAGQYTVTARAMTNMPSSAGAAAARPAGQESMALWATQEIVVSGQPVSDLVLSMHDGMTISGRVVLEGSVPVDVTRMRLTASIAGYFPGEIAPVVVSPDAEGRFTLRGVVPGLYRIASYPSAPGAAMVKSSMFGGRDTLDFPLEVKPGEDVAGGVVTLVPRLAEVTGQLQNPSSQPATGFTIVLFSSDARYWTPRSRRVQAVRPSTDGRFTLKDLPAGEYRLVALTDVDSGQWYDPAFLRELVPASIVVTLSEGERREQTLRVGR
jgi:hypothetical protein